MKIISKIKYKINNIIYGKACYNCGTHNDLIEKDEDGQKKYICKNCNSAYELLSAFITMFKNHKAKELVIPDSAPDDPLPERDKGEEYVVNRGEIVGISDMQYMSNPDEIVAFAKKYAIMPIPIVLNDGRRKTIDNFEEFEKYIRNIALCNLIEGTDNRVRYVICDSRPNIEDKDVIGMFVVRCGDCGLVAGGEFHGNPDMGDSAYAIYHRKNYFCDNFDWIQLGGHGYHGGRVMICPECAKKYKKVEQ